MENEVVIHVRAEDETDRVFTSIKGKAKKFGEDLERDLKRSGSKAGRNLADGISDGLDKAGPVVVGQATILGKDVEDEMREAGKRAGTALGDGIDEGMKSGGKGGDGDGGGLVPKLGKKGIQAGETFAESFSGVLSGLGNDPRILAAGAGVVAVLAPVLGAGLGAAIIGGAAGVGIVGGFLAASQDPRVKGAAIALKDIVSDDLKASVQPFIPAALGAIDQVRVAWKGIVPDIKSIFAQSGGLMEPLLDGVLDGVASLVDAIDISLGDAEPVVESFGDLARTVFSSVGDVMVMISDNADALAAGVDFLAGSFEAAIDAVGIFIEVSAGLIDFFRPIGGLVADAGNAIDDWIAGLMGADEASEGTTEGQEGLAEATANATTETERQLTALRELEETMRKNVDPLFEVIDLQTKVKLAQEKYNKAVKEGGEDSGKARKALLDMGKASFDLTSALTTAASEGFDGKLTPAMRNALKNAGNTTGQIDKLEKELIAAWRAANKWSGTYTQTYIVEHKGQNTIGGTGYSGLATGGIMGAATGGAHSGMRMVGEAGPELVNLPPGSHVYGTPAVAGARIGRPHVPASALSRGGDVRPVTVTFEPAGLNPLVRAIMQMLRAEIREEGGNVQTVMGSI